MRNYRNFVKETIQYPNEASEYLKASLDEKADQGFLNNIII